MIVVQIARVYRRRINMLDSVILCQFEVLKFWTADSRQGEYIYSLIYS